MLVRMGTSSKIGTIEFDGIEYPDGGASNPETLGLMQGAPPPAAKRIRFEDNRVVAFRQILWGLSNMREVVLTVAVWRGAVSASKVSPSRDHEASIDAL